MKIELIYFGYKSRARQYVNYYSELNTFISIVTFNGCQSVSGIGLEL